MDDIRDSFSKMKKDLKHRLKGRKYKPDRTGVNAAGETVDSSDSLLRPDSRILARGDDGEGSRTSTEGQQVRSRDRSPQPEPMPAGGSGNDGGVDGKETSQRHSGLDPEVEVAVGSGPGREVERAHPSPSTPSIPPTGEPDSTREFSFQLSYLIIHLDAVPDHAPEDVRPNESDGQSAATNENKSNWRSTMSATAKLLLRGVNESADAFGPLKSVAGGLCFILENCEVWSSSHTGRNAHRCPSERRQTNRG